MLSLRFALALTTLAGLAALSLAQPAAPRGPDLALARAHWVTRDTILWNGPFAVGWSASLHGAADGGLVVAGAGVDGGEAIPLTMDPAGPDARTRDRFPHLARCIALRLPATALARVPALLRGQVVVAVRDAAGRVADATAVQVPGVLDDLYVYDGPLGPSFDRGLPTVRVWAPTAQDVTLQVHDGPATEEAPREVAMARDARTGVWTATGPADWAGRYYAFKVRVFVRATGRVETNVVTDPYSVALSRNSQRSQFLDLDAASTMPEGWQATEKPPLRALEDIALYELHVRDFSAADPRVPEALRGTFEAFTVAGSHGMRHLATLARAGITHVHLLPVFDIATIDEDRSRWHGPEGDLATFPPDSEQQQARVAAVADRDGFNWGYDPWHYSVPEGSYATQPDGAPRVRAFRAMVQALNRLGLRVVMDVVYNHTTASGQDPRSVLDRIVPGYYHRLDADGKVERSTCCENTASEHAMMRKLLVDSLRWWATRYRIDGFRFDLMGHHMKRDMVAVRAMLDGLAPDRDGVDGRRIYVYGEGWDFGEVANNARGVNATQANLAGSGIGTFNDRFRDGARGGTPFNDPREQGFVTGLFYAPNGLDQPEARAALLRASDWLRLGLAGNLAGYVLRDARGELVEGKAVDYRGSRAGYAASPAEVVNYVEAHDNETLFDVIQLKAPAAATRAQRLRMQNLATSLVALAQGVPFFHAGQELLRSKSLDRNSFNSGDWFNRLDLTYQANNWGVGLPPARENRDHWPLMKPLLANPELKPTAAEIAATLAHFTEMLAIRRSSPLFRLSSADAVTRHVSFPDAGPEQTPGVIVLRLSDLHGEFDTRYRDIVALFNARLDAAAFAGPSLGDGPFLLHPVLAASTDPIVRTASFDGAGRFTVPAQTTAVFVRER